MTAPRSPSWLLQPTYPPYRVLPKVLSRRRIDRPVMCAVARRKQKVTFPALPSLCRTSPMSNVFLSPLHPNSPARPLTSRDEACRQVLAGAVPVTIAQNLKNHVHTHTSDEQRRQAAACGERSGGAARRCRLRAHGACEGARQEKGSWRRAGGARCV